MSTVSTLGDDARPVLRVISGSPTPEELAVVTALVGAAGEGASTPAAGARRGGWSDPAALHRRPLIPGPNAWRSALTP
jgi:hypothetical protein